MATRTVGVEPLSGSVLEIEEFDDFVGHTAAAVEHDQAVRHVVERRVEAP